VSAPEGTSVPRVVIVGGGFGGLYAARGLARAPVRVTLVDRVNYHLFQPLLYQVATAALSPGDIAQPIRSILSRQKNADVVLGEVLSVDVARRRLVLDGGDEIPYDRLIVAAGARHSYFGREDFEREARGLKSLEDALDIRRRFLLAFEAAEREASSANPTDVAALLTFVVVGGGPTGVELAGAIGEIAHGTLASDFRAIDPSHARVVLVEAGPRILASFPESLSQSAAAQLARLGVEVKVTSRLEEILPGRGVRLTNGPGSPHSGEEWIAARTVLWAAGVQASGLAVSLGAPLDRAGRVLVEPDLTLPGRPEIQVIGDLACFRHGTEAPLPGVAPVAIQQGRYAARRIVRLLQGRSVPPFRYVDKGNAATIGRSSGIADLGWLGFPASRVGVLGVQTSSSTIGFKGRIVCGARMGMDLATPAWRAADAGEPCPEPHPEPRPSSAPMPRRIRASDGLHAETVTPAVFPGSLSAARFPPGLRGEVGLRGGRIGQDFLIDLASAGLGRRPLRPPLQTDLRPLSLGDTPVPNERSTTSDSGENGSPGTFSVERPS
jgi:NADH dehydrogenase